AGGRGGHADGADTDRDVVGAARSRVAEVQRLDGREQTVHLRVHGLAVGLRQHDGEFFAAVARHDVTGPAGHDRQLTGHGAQTIVAARVPVGVVVGLEVVDVDD